MLEWHTLPSSLFPLPYKVIGNIPYYITSPLIEKALTPPLPAVVVFLVQREFADRVGAQPGSRTYGALSAGVQAVADVERLFTVRAGAFRPPPKVDSAVIRLTPKVEPLVAPGEHPAFRAFLARLFSQRRKQLGRSLRAVTGGSKESVEQLLHDAGIDPERRPEVLAPERLVDLFRRAESLTPQAESG
jgi:16S rRNA (adenine1518-N6/adenine1519-N6)-dimethyltransferase